MVWVQCDLDKRWRMDVIVTVESTYHTRSSFELSHTPTTELMRTLATLEVHTSTSG